MNFATARAVPGEPNVSATPVCGRETRRAVYYATRRLSGTGPSRNFQAGNWNRHPARLAVYGMARGAKRIVVQAGASQLRTMPRLNGAFLVFLPLSTRIDAVRVTVDGKAHGPTFGAVTPPKPARASAASGTGR